MEKRYLFELSEDELKKVLEVNNRFWIFLVETHYEDNDYFVGEGIAILNGDGCGIIVDYKIDPDEYSYIHFSEFNYCDVLDNTQDFIDNYGATDNIETKLEEAYKYQEFTNQAYRLFDDNDDLGKEYGVDKIINETLLNELYEKTVKDLSQLLANYLSSWYNFDNDVLLSVLETVMVDDPKRFYIKDDSYIVYETKEVVYE